jgi:hypothetical protein
LPIKPKDNQQSFYVPSYESERSAAEIKEQEEELPSVKKDQNRPSVNLEVGTSVSSDFNGNSAISTYASPYIRHQIDDRIAVSGGVMMSQTFFNGWTNYSMEGSPMPSSVTTNMVYGRLEYQLNERMLLYGSVYTNLTTIPMQGYNQQLQGVGYSVGMKYRMSERSFIQVEIQRSSGYNPFMPYSNFGFGGRPISYFP